MSGDKKREVIDLTTPDRSSTKRARVEQVEDHDDDATERSRIPQNDCPPPRLLILQEDTLTKSAKLSEEIFEKLAKIRFCSTCASPQQKFRLIHLQQQDQWSCGYRNAQMVLASLLSCVPQGHSYYSGRAYDESVAEIPSVDALQHLMEESWREGYDAASAMHYNGKIVGKRQYIGTLEVGNLFSFCGIDNTVVQFIKSRQSRGKLGSFCFDYFERKAPCCFCSPVSSFEIVGGLLEGRRAERTCECPVLPLMLQWSGHSVTVVGCTTDRYDRELLVLDPQRSGKMLLDRLDLQDVSSMRMRVEDLERKDTQVLVVSLAPLSEEEKRDLKRMPSIVTAARETVI